MRAVIATGFDAEPSLTDLPLPEPGPGEVRVRLAAAGVNPFDWKVVDGAMRGQVDHAFPLVLGSDGAGVVDAVGSGVHDLRPGERVFGQFMDVVRGRGSYAEYALAPAEGKLAALPTTLPFDVAAALPTASAGGCDIFSALGVAEGQTVLINGATGGVGQSAVQFGVAAGARVIATSDPSTAGHMRELGASELVDYTQTPTVDQVRQAHPGGIDAVLDLVSGPGEADAVAGLLKPGGIIVSPNGALDTDELVERGLRGANVFARVTPELLDRVAGSVLSGELKIRIDYTAPLEQAPAALGRSRAGSARGKIVLSIQD